MGADPVRARTVSVGHEADSWHELAMVAPLEDLAGGR